MELYQWNISNEAMKGPKGQKGPKNPKCLHSTGAVAPVAFLVLVAPATFLGFSSKKVWFFMSAMQNIFVALTYPSLYR